jgi:hypothetical protein
VREVTPTTSECSPPPPLQAPYPPPPPPPSPLPPPYSPLPHSTPHRTARCDEEHDHHIIPGSSLALTSLPPSLPPSGSPRTLSHAQESSAHLQGVTALGPSRRAPRSSVAFPHLKQNADIRHQLPELNCGN